MLRTFQLAHPIINIQSGFSEKSKNENKREGEWSVVPGLGSPQSAHRSLPGTLRIRSWRVFSLRNCWRLLIAATIVEG